MTADVSIFSIVFAYCSDSQRKFDSTSLHIILTVTACHLGN